MEPDEATRPQPQKLLGRYRVERTLGSGGMGEVLLAWDELLGRRVAIKRLDPQGHDRDARRRAMLKEARRASSISDRRIAAIHDVVDLDGEVMLVMEYVDGVTLRQRLERPIPLEEFWSIAIQATEGVAAAHAHGVIHRDLKPENLMLTRGGELKLLDFGISRRRALPDDPGTGATESSSGHVAGTPHYMAPEAHVAGAVDERTDLFSLGVVFYEMLTGRRPFEGTTYAAVVNEILNLTPPPVAELNPDSGEALSRVVAGMLAKHPGDRVPSATDLLERLNRARLGQDSQWPSVLRPVPIPPSRRLRDRARARRVGLGAAAALVIAAGTALAVKVATAPRLPERFVVAVLPPSTPTARGDFADFALGAATVLERRLRRHADAPGFQSALFREVLEEEVRTAPEAGRALGADVALIATLEQTTARLRARLELRECERDRLIASRSFEEPADRPFVWIDRLYRESARLLRQRPIGDSATALDVHGAGTLRLVLRGLGRLAGAKDSAAARSALSAFDDAVRTEPDAAGARIGQASAEVKLNELTGAPEWLARADASSLGALAADSTLGEALFCRGVVLRQLKRKQESEEALGRAAALLPFDDDVVLRYARSYAHAGEPDREREVYDDTIRRRPHDWRAHWWLATWLHRQGRIEEAKRSYEAMTRCAPGLPLGYSNLGALRILTGDYRGAIEALRRSNERQPSMRAYSNLGTAYFNLRRFDEAADAFNQSFQFGEPSYVTWANLGDAYHYSGNREPQAREAYAQGLAGARQQLRRLARQGGAFNPAIVADVAVIFARLGQPDSARAWLRSALAADSANWQVQYGAALVSWELADRTLAIERLGRALRGGYPVVWIRDSPMFTEWRESPGFRALIQDTLGTSSEAATRGGGG